MSGLKTKKFLSGISFIKFNIPPPVSKIFFPSSIAALIVFIIAILFTRYVSLGSILGCIFAFISMVVFNLFNLFDASYYDLIYIIPAVSIIIYKHKENILRLMDNNENKLSFKKI